MSHTLVTFLGRAGNYQSTTYRFPDGETATTRYFGLALRRKLQADHLVMFGASGSGWDLAKWQPKPAQRIAPVGSVYWFDDFQGKAKALGKFVAEGFWAMSDYPDRSRRTEGFNNVLIAAWPKTA